MKIYRLGSPGISEEHAKAARATWKSNFSKISRPNQVGKHCNLSAIYWSFSCNLLRRALCQCVQYACSNKTFQFGQYSKADNAKIREVDGSMHDIICTLACQNFNKFVLIFNLTRQPSILSFSSCHWHLAPLQQSFQLLHLHM